MLGVHQMTVSVKVIQGNRTDGRNDIDTDDKDVDTEI